ncbi:hypothetical protein GF340_00035 [Candidatus Peregrinibacteria bacterium]|nr:hypothetical protein [Candidatus Peregrinibacteria bacterium]
MMNKRFLQFSVSFFSLFLLSFIWVLPFALAASSGDVIINEVNWAGDDRSSSNEWIELYNPGTTDISVDGWSIEDDGVALPALAGVVPARGFYLIEDNEESVPNILADMVMGLSLANSGDALTLKDETGNIIDAVNSTGGSWFAGGSNPYLTMERIDATVSGDDETNFADSEGSPLAVNLNSIGSGNVYTNASTMVPAVGDTVTVGLNVSGVAELFSYGFELNYDPSILEFVDATPSGLLSNDGVTDTSFQAGLEDGVQGKLLIAEARTGVSEGVMNADGLLVNVNFNVVGGDGLISEIGFGNESFVSDSFGQVPVSFAGMQLEPGGIVTVPGLTNLNVIEAASRFQLQLSWDLLETADAYRVYRKDVNGEFVLLEEVNTALFVDKDGVSNGGVIIPQVNYEYGVSVVQDGVESDVISEIGFESRGLKADNDRSDRVDGKDLDALARSFAMSVSESDFNPYADTNYDGWVDGSDLIDLAAEFAMTY